MRSVLKTSLAALGFMFFAFVLAASAKPTARASEESKIPFAEITAEFMAEHKLKDAKADPASFDAFVDGPAYVQIALGVYDLRYPDAGLADSARADEFRGIVDALLAQQLQWLEWSASAHARFKEAKADIATLQKWVKTWSASALAGAARSDELDLLASTRASKPTVEASARWAELMRSGEMLSMKLDDASGERIVFAPDRKAYLGIMGFCGWLDPTNRATYWHDSHAKSTNAWFGHTQILALEYPAWPVDVARPTRGASMNELEKTGLLQHVVQNATQSLFLHYFEVGDAIFFALGNATNITIAVVGENNVRTGGAVLQTSGNQTMPYERFVPGGNSAGGTLPPNSAMPGVTEDKPLWRTTLGRDYFVKPLRKAQEEGAELAAKDKAKAKEKRAHFLITGHNKANKTFVSAPFMGKVAEGKAVPATEYIDDYEDFFRAYTAGFYRWMQTAAVPKNAKASADKYAELIQVVAARESNLSFDDAVAQVYGVPLSAATGETDSLEWRFLEWLSKN